MNVIKTKTYSILTIGLFAFILLSCKEGNEPRNKEQYVIIPKDTLYLAADSSEAKMLGILIQVYEGLNPYRKVIPLYGKENTLYTHIKTNRVDLILRSYALTPTEKEAVLARHLNPKVFVVWQDALALIVNKASGLDEISEKEFKSAILKPTKARKVVLDKASTAAYNLLCEKYVPNPDQLNAYAAGNEEAVIAQVKKDMSSIGLINSIYFSGFHDSKDTLLKGVKIIGMIPDTMKSVQYPFQDQIYNGLYPLSRSIYTIDVGALDGLASSFVAFILSERGQRIILKSGLLPAVIPPRTVEIN